MLVILYVDTLVIVQITVQVDATYRCHNCVGPFDI